MTPSFADSPFSGLLCVEDSNSALLLNDNDSPRAVSSSVSTLRRQNSGLYDAGEGEDFPMSEMLLSGEGLGELLEKELQYMPEHDYLNRLRSGDLDIGARKDAIDWIRKFYAGSFRAMSLNSHRWAFLFSKLVHAHFKFGPLSAYLSISYFDRFASAYELPRGKPWMTQLLAVACLSLAAKLVEIEVPLSPDLQVDGSKYVFEARTVKRMELLVMNKLSWRMQAVTPFSFIDHFLWKINGDKIPPKASMLRSIQILLRTIEVMEFLELKPSVIAAAVAISVEGERGTVDTAKAVLILSHDVEKERVLKCIDLIHNLELASGSTKCAAVSSVPQSPVGVLDTPCLSYRSDETTFRSCADSSGNTPQTKRLKIDR